MSGAAAKAVDCPICGAEAGRPCVVMGDGAVRVPQAARKRIGRAVARSPR